MTLHWKSLDESWTLTLLSWACGVSCLAAAPGEMCSSRSRSRTSLSHEQFNLKGENDLSLPFLVSQLYPSAPLLYYWTCCFYLRCFAVITGLEEDQAGKTEQVKNISSLPRPGKGEPPVCVVKVADFVFPDNSHWAGAGSASVKEQKKQLQDVAEPLTVCKSDSSLLSLCWNE